MVIAPLVALLPNAVPPYSMALGERQVDFRYGEQTGSLPTEALLKLADVNQPAAAA